MTNHVAALGLMTSARGGRGWFVVASVAAALGLGGGLVEGPLARASDPAVADPAAAVFYSTARPPADFEGMRPGGAATADSSLLKAGLDELAEPVAGATAPATAPALLSPAAVPPPANRAPIAVADATLPAHAAASDVGSQLPPPAEVVPDPAAERVLRAKQTIAACWESYQKLTDYTCVFYKRERIGGTMGPHSILHMKARTQPTSIYFRFVQPNTGREAIWVANRHQGRVVVHDVGFNKLLAGTLLLDPTGARAMEDNRHPITEAGLGHLIRTVAHRWASEMHAGETQVTITPGMKVGDRVCTMIESTHPQRHARFMFYSVKVYIDQEHNLPIRFEAYDWPRGPGATPELVEEYTYMNLRLNTGLSERDFDPENEQYSFGRF